jgi:hypothetical protein
MLADEEVFVEAIFENGRIADTFITDHGINLEVTDSETESECKTKLENYPDGVKSIQRTSKYWIDKYAGIGVYELLKLKD